MEVPSSQDEPDADADGVSDETATAVRAHVSRPGRVVFTEAGNTDGWIASDLAIDPEP